jgi:toxin CcdB
VPQFTVYKNPGRDEAIPFVVQLQSTRLDRSMSRVVMALVRVSPGSPTDHPLTPRITVQNQTVYANPLNIATVPLRRLTDMLEVLPESDQDRIVRAIDEMISRV